MTKGNRKGTCQGLSRHGLQLCMVLCFLCTLVYFRPDPLTEEAVVQVTHEKFDHGHLGSHQGSLRKPVPPIPLKTKAEIASPIVEPTKTDQSAPRSSAGDAGSGSSRQGRWNAAQIVSYMDAHPSRAYFTNFFKLGGFKSGIEVGVADGRFSEHVLMTGRPATWRLCEPFPNDALISRYPPAGEKKRRDEQSNYASDRAKQKKELVTKTWEERDILKGVNLIFLEHYSTDKEVVEGIPKGTIDFVYLDGAHDYENVKKELEPFWEMLAPGGVLAGHDYQNHGQKGLKCKGCDNVPKARTYTEFGIRHGKPSSGVAKDMNKVVTAVQEWVDDNHPEVTLHHTMENFTKESLAADGLNYDLVITNTFNPSWYFIKGA